ncbi:CpsD/CapB family tyrosine-protein kinase [Paenibacillus allorhizosphaerae]|uniref:non-specific protein-tyrosine kinase n=1 Tax=Paenibacillus allorhizosphaerae TaxID=2849866 RepID=A0ABM8VES9_9BACL|nr:CpsD/CapB family tyrosine-protein kinase [Paenibacillus allorhizosphaerae]CAG7632524.1 Tyrosine-protein kinase YwqD [Paenibacillus allorhizosphaerae]
MPKLKDRLELLPKVDEAFTELKVNLDFSIKKNGMQSLAVLSGNAGEGRTTSCLNLAMAYAKAGKKVVVLDADFRNPSTHVTFGDSNHVGLSKYLAKQAPYGDIVKNSAYPGLMYIPAGPSPLNAPEQLASAEMDLLMQDLKQHFDVIVVDTPPAQKFIDAKIMAAKCDGVLLVMEYGKVRPAAAQRLKEELTHAAAQLVGILLNKVTVKNI